MARKFDFKAVLINHGEKFVAGIVALLAVISLATASWSGYEKTPEELEQIATQTLQQMEVPEWSPEEQEKFASTPDVRRLAKLMAEETTDREKYATSRSWNELLIRNREKRTAVAVLAPEDPEVSVVSVPIAMPPEELVEEESDLVADATGADAEELTDEEEERLKAIREQFGQTTPLRGGAGAGGYPGLGGAYDDGGGAYDSGAYGSGGYPGGVPGSMSSGGGYPGGGMSSGGGYPGGGMSSGGGYPGGGGGYPGAGGGYPGGGGAYDDGGGAYDGGGYGGGGYGYGGSYGAAKVNKRVRLAVGASVRMVVDLRQQRKEISDALHISGGHQATQQHINYVELHVERKHAVEGPDPWAGDWEPLRREDYAEILTESLGVDQDIVSPAVTRNTITMPLPRRAAGQWRTNEASHHRLENFELSEDEKNLINKMNELILQRAEAAKAALPPRVAEQKGFTEFVRDVTQIQQDVMGAYGGEDSFYSGLYGDLEGAMGEDFRLTDEQKQVLDASRATADHRLLLVRLMDFTVERGKAYRYRVRLEMRNPNFDIPLDQLAQPELGEQKTLMSDWSVPTEPIPIPMEYRYYVAGVDARPGSIERVDFPIYFEHSEAGMPVMGEVEVPVGMPIGGYQKREFVNLAEETLESADVNFRTRDLLAAAIEAPRPSASEHPSLAKELNRVPRGEDPIPDQVIVLEHDGSLKMRMVGDRLDQQAQDKLQNEEILKIYEAWRPRAAPVGGGLFGEGGEGAYAGGGEYGMGMGMSGGSALSGGGYGYGGAGAYGAGGGDGKRMSSRERARLRRQNPQAFGPPGGRPGYEN